jgi:hypothetical protein
MAFVDDHLSIGDNCFFADEGKISVIAKATITARGSVMGEEKRRRNPAKRGKP